MKNNTYLLIDSGTGRKLEKFGPYLISRPASQAVWKPLLPESQWSKAHATFTRESDTKWQNKSGLKDMWNIEVADIIFKIAPTDFGHLGIFPEQNDFWKWIQQKVKEALNSGRKEVNVLNLFAYSGGSTLAAAKAGAKVCHLDASKGMVAWARENASLNGLEGAPIRWIIDDVNKFLKRELKRESRYDAIILDPPTFGRGTKGELFKIEDDIGELLSSCAQLLTSNPLFVLFSCHTPGFTPIAMHHLMQQLMGHKKGTIDTGEMLLKGEEGTFSLPSGTFARWYHES